MTIKKSKLTALASPVAAVSKKIVCVLALLVETERKIPAKNGPGRHKIGVLSDGWQKSES